MKNILGYIYVDGKRKTREGDCLKDKSIDENLTKRVEETKDKLKDRIDNIIPKWLIILAYILLLLALIFGAFFITRIVRLKFFEAYKSYSYTMYISLILFVIYMGIFIYSRIRIGLFTKSKEYKELYASLDKLTIELVEVLGIPEDYKIVDAFICGYVYDENNNKVYVKENNFLNFPFCAYSDSDYLYLSDFHDVLKIEKNVILRSLIEEEVYFNKWNKEEEFNSPKFEKYDIEKGKIGYSISSYYRIVFNTRFGDYELLLPGYEKDAMEELL